MEARILIWTNWEWRCVKSWCLTRSNTVWAEKIKKSFTVGELGFEVASVGRQVGREEKRMLISGRLSWKREKKWRREEKRRKKGGLSTQRYVGQNAGLGFGAVEICKEPITQQLDWVKMSIPDAKMQGTKFAGTLVAAFSVALLALLL